MAGFYDSRRVHRATRKDNYVVNLPNRPLLEVIHCRKGHAVRTGFILVLVIPAIVPQVPSAIDDEQGAAAFDHVVSGMDVVRKIQQQPTKGQSLEPPITIVSAKRVTP